MCGLILAVFLAAAGGLGCAEGDPGPAGSAGPVGPAGPPGPTGPINPGGRTALFLTEIGRFVPDTIIFDDGAAEITAYDPASRRAFVVNAAADRVDVLDLSVPSTPTLIASTSSVGSPNSVAVYDGLVAVAYDRGTDDAPARGHVVFYRASDLVDQGSAEVGFLPDMVTFTPDGRTVLVANEGEPNDAVTDNPEGSISIVDVSGTLTDNMMSVEVGFTDFNVGGSRADEFPNGIRQIFPGATRSEDLEPEFIAVSDDGATAYVTLQEHNALAIVDVATASVAAILDLGVKRYSIPGNEFDPSDRDSGINLDTWPVVGLYQPDGIAAYTADNGRTYLVTANEGDAADYSGFSEELRVGDLTLDPAVFPNAAALQAEAALGRLRTSSTAVDITNASRIVAYGGRSFSIWDGTTGALVFDSGNDFERITAVRLGDDFNASNDGNGGDARSDDKGPEPEGVVVGRIGTRFYAFIGLERVGGIMVYDITQPESPFFVQYVNNRDFGAPDAQLENAEAGDSGPEGLTFVRSADSPTGRPLLIVGNETTGTTTIYEMTTVD